ncbi:MAG: glycoside hydrolase family 38 C-terminal domain-containing protein [Bacteroidota bacterium]|nr:glycoside hydrolase family 38 C-terminal domain-containing protein [Bacteroidota bacterium]
MSKSKLSKGKILLMNSSHQDLAWMDFLEKCIIERDTMLMTPLLKAALKDPGYRFDIEDVLMIREYLGRHPEAKTDLVNLLKQGRLTCGSTYQMPYEEMYSGESLVRQFYLGARWIRENLDGYFPDTYWNPDVPGRTMQMAQIMAKSGTKNLVMSRHEKGVYKWYSPDGSFVYAYSPGHYSEDFGFLGKSNFQEVADIMAKKSIYWEKGYNDKPGTKPVIPFLSDWDMSPAKDYSRLINEWTSLNKYTDEKGKIRPLILPQIRLATAPEFIKIISESTLNLPAISGERPAVWLYIHGPSHEWALKASREGDIMMTVAEKFSTIDALLRGTFSYYPVERLNRAWEAKIYPDHGWGGKGGESTDAIFLRKFEESLAEASSITETALNGIASRINLKRENGIPVIVFNSLSWQRDDPVSFRIGFDQGVAFDLSLKDASGNEVAVQLTDIGRYNDNSIKKAEAVFIAREVPSIGYKTYYVVPVKSAALVQNPLENKFETQFYRIELEKGCVKSIYDKELNIEILSCRDLLGGDVFTLKSVGNGAGEFADVQQPEMEGFDKVSNHNPEWRFVSSGPVFTEYKMRQQIKNAVVETDLKVYSDLKKIDFETSLLNWEGVLYREYRFALPLDMKNGKVCYEVPFGVLEVGKDEISGAAGERYVTKCGDVHPRGIGNWIGASDGRFGVTLSTSTAVADYIDPTGLSGDALVLQPVMLASRRSCHSQGNEYLQTGNHFYHYSLTSHKSGFQNGYKFGRQANEKLIAIVDPIPARDNSLPESLSFFSVDASDISISAIKKAEDGNETVIRLYENGISDAVFNLRSWFNISSADETSMIEYDGKSVIHTDNTVPLKIGRHSIETLKLKLK